MSNSIDCFLVGSINRNAVSIKDANLLSNKATDGNKNNITNKPQKNDSGFNGAVAYLGTYLHRRGLSFDYINYIEEEYPILVEKIKSGNIMCVAISSTFCISTEYMKKIIDKIKHVKPDIKIIVGGQFIAMLIKKNINSIGTLKKYLILMGADFYINSFQGEDTLVKLLRSLKGEVHPANVPNLFYRSDNTFKYTQTVPEDNNLEENMVDWNLFSGTMYEEVPVRTSISCLFNCSFCNYKTNHGKYSSVGIHAIEQELDSVQQQRSIQTVRFVDDTFNIPKERFKEILRLMARKNYKFDWYSFLRCQYLDMEEVELMKESRCKKVLLGIESGSQKILNNMNKQVRVDDLKRGISLLNDYGIHTIGSFIIGFPGETEDTVRETIDFVNEVNLSIAGFQPWFYDETTPISKEKEKYGITGEGYNWKHSTMTYPAAQKHVDNIFSYIKTK